MENAAVSDGIVCLLTDQIDEDVLSRCPRLRVIANVATGYDNIDLAAASARGIAVTNTPGILDETTADFAFALLMAAARRVAEADRRAGRWTTWSPTELLGVSGRRSASSGWAGWVRPWHGGGAVSVCGCSTAAARKPELEEELDLAAVDLPELLSESDFVSLHVWIPEV